MFAPRGKMLHSLHLSVDDETSLLFAAGNVGWSGNNSHEFYIHVTVHRDKFPYNKTNQMN
jgi:hypothetical protein